MLPERRINITLAATVAALLPGSGFPSDLHVSCRGRPMNPQNILIVSARPTAGLRLWPNRFTPDFAATDEAAIELVQRQSFDAIVIDTTDPELLAAKLQALLPILRPEVPLFRFEGDGTPAIQETVQEHFRRERNARIRKLVVFNENPSSLDPLPAFSAN
jgi:CheY-like chemotaxis protein